MRGSHYLHERGTENKIAKVENNERKSLAPCLSTFPYSTSVWERKETRVRVQLGPHRGTSRILSHAICSDASAGHVIFKDHKDLSYGRLPWSIKQAGSASFSESCKFPQKTRITLDYLTAVKFVIYLKKRVKPRLPLLTHRTISQHAYPYRPCRG